MSDWTWLAMIVGGVAFVKGVIAAGERMGRRTREKLAAEREAYRQDELRRIKEEVSGIRCLALRTLVGFRGFGVGGELRGMKGEVSGIRCLALWAAEDAGDDARHARRPPCAEPQNLSSG